MVTWYNSNITLLNSIKRNHSKLNFNFAETKKWKSQWVSLKHKGLFVHSCRLAIGFCKASTHLPDHSDQTCANTPPVRTRANKCSLCNQIPLLKICVWRLAGYRWGYECHSRGPLLLGDKIQYRHYTVCEVSKLSTPTPLLTTSVIEKNIFSSDSLSFNGNMV